MYASSYRRATMSNELTQHSGRGIFRPGALTGLAAKKAALAQAQLALKPEERSPNAMEHRIGIVFDESGSMRAPQLAMAKEGVEEFLRSCERDKTAVAVYPLSSNSKKIELCAQLPAVAMMVKQIATGSTTPLVQRLQEMLAQNNLTRAIVFSDGQPDSYKYEQYESILASKIPVDTVYITSIIREPEVAFLKKLASDTGGIYLQFEQGKSNFATAFKYLAPGMRYMLADKSFVAGLEGR